MIIDLTFIILILNIIIYYKVIDWSLVGFVFWFNDLYSFLSYFIKNKNMRILKSHPLLKLVNSYLIDASQPSNISYL